MKKILFILLAFSTLFLSPSCKKEDVTGEKLRLICEELRPYSYLENNQLKGISADIVGNIAHLAGLDSVTVEVSDWSNALNILETSENIALFTTGINAERKDMFKWVGPITMFSSDFVSLTSNDLMVTSVADAKALPSIGVVEGYPTTTMLQNEGFQNLTVYTSLTEAVAGLFKGAVSTVFDINLSIRMIASEGHWDVSSLVNMFTYATIQGYIAFSMDVSDKLVDNWQDKLDLLKKQGTVQEIYDKYLPGSTAPGLISIFTEENPPQSFKYPDGSLTGSSVEMVEAMMWSIPANETITSTVWTDAFNQIMVAPNSMTFSTLRTDQRENIFKWVGPICKKSYCFYVRAGSPIQLNEIDDAKGLTAVGVPTGWASEQELIDRGFTNLQSWSTPVEVFQKLIDGTIDAAVLNDIAIPSIAEQLGLSTMDVRMALILSSGETWLAFSLDTKEEYIQQWETAYTTIKNNGKFGEIWHKWYPNIDW